MGLEFDIYPHVSGTELLQLGLDFAKEVTIELDHFFGGGGCTTWKKRRFICSSGDKLIRVRVGSAFPLGQNYFEDRVR